MSNKMVRLTVTLALAAMATLVVQIASAQQQDFSKVEIKVTKVSGNIYMLEGAGGNIAASVGEDGIVIVDDHRTITAITPAATRRSATRARR